MSEKLPNQQGASAAKLGVSDKLGAYFRNHQMVAVESLAKLLSTPASSLLTWLVIAIALTLPGALYMAVNNLQQLSGHFEASGQMTVFLTTDIREADSNALRLKVGSLDQVNKVVYVSPEQALEEFTQYGGISEALSFLDENPLPAVLLVEPPLGIDKAELNVLVAQIKSFQNVDSVQVDMAWVERLLALLALAQRLVAVVGVLLALAIVLVVGNTIRLSIAARTEEIRVIKLVGGTNAYVRRPFLYSGFWYGAIGGILAWLMLGLCWILLQGPVADIAELYGADFHLQPLPFTPASLLILSASLLGLIGSWWSVQRHLVAIEP
jgi:cell division transport system permease protein|tara:strand:- start:987 stop:1958 length:972 start_codon:yes stop_codon:yes gene_type:complete